MLLGLIRIHAHMISQYSGVISRRLRVTTVILPAPAILMTLQLSYVVQHLTKISQISLINGVLCLH